MAEKKETRDVRLRDGFESGSYPGGGNRTIEAVKNKTHTIDRDLARFAVGSGYFEYVHLEPKSPPPAATLPDTFPHSKLLIASGFDTLLQVQSATDEQILNINGIGDKFLAEIRDAQTADKGDD